MTTRELEFQDLVDFFDHIRIPLSGLEREKRQGPYRYYGAQSVIDYVDDYLFDGEYVLIAEDGANLITRNEPIAQLVSGQFWVNNHAHIVRAKEKVSTNRFINFLINSNNLTGYVTGAAQPKLSQKNLRLIKFQVPDYESQLAIDDLISKYDYLIENNKRRIELLEESARQLYKEWFVRFRFPGHEHVKIIDGVPEGWKPCNVGDLFTLQRGFDLPVRDRIDGNIPVYASTGINGYHNEHKVKGPGLVTGRSGSLGKVIYISKDFWPLNTALWIKEFKQVDVCFALYLLRNLKLENYNGGAAVPTLNRNDVHSIETFLPPQNMLESFSENIKPVFAQIDLLDEQNIKLTKARDLLLPKLMSGAINV
ncbi:MAG: restriction endonuclease subunit S [Methylomicrobium sp.]|nr:restriction endonuclease subunit S [Methylomicrobium sp.]